MSDIGDRGLLEGGRKWELIAEFQPYITRYSAALPWWCQKSSESLEKQPLTFVEWRFSGLVGDVRLGPSLQQGKQAVQVAPAGGQVKSCLLIEGALIDCAGVCCGETASPKSLWHVIQKYLQHHHFSKSLEFLVGFCYFLFHEQSKLRIYCKVTRTLTKYLNESPA